jgi:hypothetical protein
MIFTGADANENTKPTYKFVVCLNDLYRPLTVTGAHCQLTMSFIYVGLCHETQARGAGAIENDEFPFKEDVTTDGGASLSVGLDATKAF